jgi:hypothetical protein
MPSAAPNPLLANRLPLGFLLLLLNSAYLAACADPSLFYSPRPPRGHERRQRFSSFNNQWYRKSVEYMQDVVGTRPSKWCAGCHDHAVFFNGRFDRPIKEQLDTPEAHAGLGCTSCHSIVQVKSTMGQGDFTIEYPPLHDLAVSENPLLRWGHDYLLKVDPKPHRDTFLKPFHGEQTPEFCSVCHKVHLDVPVNAYRWFRGFNEYDNWQASGVSGEGARSFYYPARPQKCADCHMPLVDSDDPAAKNGKVRSHRFPGANTALPYVNQDHEQLRATQEFLREGQVSVDVFGLVRGGRLTPPVPAKEVATAGPRLASTFAQGKESMGFGASEAFFAAPPEVIAPLDKVDAAVRRGDSVRVEVVVRTRKVGHFFPGGTVDAFDVWVELLARDGKGRTIFHSGAVTGGRAGSSRERTSTAASCSTGTAIRSTRGTPGRPAPWPTSASSLPAPPTPSISASASRRTAGRRSSSRPGSTIGSSPGGTRSGPSPGCATRRKETTRSAPDTTTAAGSSPATPRRCQGRSRRSPTFPSP